MRPGRWAVVALLALAGCGGDDPHNDDADDATRPVVTTAPAPPTTAATPVGFDRVAATATTPDGTVCELCLWLADTAVLRSQGLMEVTDMGEADAMLFRYPSPTTTTFWMKDTVMPLSIAYYSGDGSFLDAYDMPPCTADPCPHYATAPAFVFAIETVEGGLEPLGLTPGSTLRVSDSACGI